ncbi:metallophosphoesterase family protein [Helicobacter turcicus]|uniref:Serine/threonine protein phosphatase n=1 Tax=Helicobacter turcicus TaxID=2867412 RepID=A0ABS7JLP0_9HELI|nr:metallophosphoesterase family protein [Helicobacter turcicus]MBX7490306.1 serine/threonine protein phosphatase [Helicobacter turcicus]MBX7545115.1 serine/threonine protein phosphatase [Helicobacter turcicus]
MEVNLDYKRPLYIIGDVHGCYKTLCALVKKFPEKENSQIVFVGDLIDRGMESCAVVDFVMEGKYPCVLGNHEELMLEYYSSVTMDRDGVWMENGGRETIQSYANYGKVQRLKEHLEFFKTLPFCLEFAHKDELGRNLFISHGFGLPFYSKSEVSHKICWSRLKHYTFCGAKYEEEKTPVFNVFGHDVQKDGVLFTKNYAAIDTGCVYYKRLSNATLSALEWPSKCVISQKYCG